MKIARWLLYILVSLMLVPSVYALELQNFFNIFQGFDKFLQNVYVQFFILIVATTTVFGLIIYYALSQTPIGEGNPRIASLLALVMGLLCTIPILFAARNKSVVTFMSELFSGWYGLAFGIFNGLIVFFLIYHLIRKFWPSEGNI